MTTFRIQQHSVQSGRAAVEVFGENGQLLGVLYADGDERLRFVSKHLSGVVLDSEFPQCAHITLVKP